MLSDMTSFSQRVQCFTNPYNPWCCFDDNDNDKETGKDTDNTGENFWQEGDDEYGHICYVFLFIYEDK